MRPGNSWSSLSTCEGSEEGPTSWTAGWLAGLGGPCGVLTCEAGARNQGGLVVVLPEGCYPGKLQTGPCGWGGDEEVKFLEEVNPQDWVRHLCQQKPMCKPGFPIFDLDGFETPGTN